MSLCVCVCVCKNGIAFHQEREKTSFVMLSGEHSSYHRSLMKHFCNFVGFFIEQIVFSQLSSSTALVLQHDENKMQQT